MLDTHREGLGSGAPAGVYDAGSGGGKASYGGGGGQIYCDRVVKGALAPWMALQHQAAASAAVRTGPDSLYGLHPSTGLQPVPAPGVGSCLRNCAT